MQDINAVLEKYAGIKKAGEDAYHKGTIKPLTGFSEALKKRMITAVMFDPCSAEAMMEYFLLPMLKHDRLNMITAGRNFPFHATILEATCDTENAILPQCYYQPTIGQEIHFDRLIADGVGSVILMATVIPHSILEMREFVGKWYIEHGLKPISLDNILHSTQVRVTAFSSLEVNQEFLALVSGLSEDLEQSPLRAKIGAIVVSNTYDFLKGL